MNTAQTEVLDQPEQPFDRDAAEEVVREASGLMARYAEDLAQVARQAEENDQQAFPALPADAQTLSLQLKVRAPDKNYAKVMDECWEYVSRIAESLNLEPIQSEASYLSKDEGVIRLRVPANLALALAQEQEYFRSVSLYTGSWH